MEELGSGQTFIFAMEESCGYLSNSHLTDKDGVNAVLFMCMIAQDYKNKERTFEDRLKQIYYEFGFYLNEQINLRFDDIDNLAD